MCLDVSGLWVCVGLSMWLLNCRSSSCLVGMLVVCNASYVSSVSGVCQAVLRCKKGVPVV